MLYIQKEGSTLSLKEDDRMTDIQMSLERFLTQRLRHHEGHDLNAQNDLKVHYRHRYLRPWYIHDKECYVATHCHTSYATHLINVMRVLSVEPLGLNTLIVFDTGCHLTLPLATKHFKRRWLEATQFVTRQKEKSYKRFHP